MDALVELEHELRVLRMLPGTSGVWRKPKDGVDTGQRQPNCLQALLRERPPSDESDDAEEEESPRVVKIYEIYGSRCARLFAAQLASHHAPKSCDSTPTG